MVRNLGKRYAHPSGGNRPPVTPSRIRRLGRDIQIQLIAEWFFSLYQDPAQETPYDGREGGYQYIHGGPYDAREEIEAEFVDYVDAEIIEAAADFVETDGIWNWAPSSQHPDRIATDRELEASQNKANRYFKHAGGVAPSPVGLVTKRTKRAGEGALYSLPWNPEVTISSSEVRNITSQRQQELIEHWFKHMFEGPAEIVDSHSDGHEYPIIQGKTYKASEAILNEFIEIADRNAISAVLSKVDPAGSLEWWPGPYHPDRMGMAAKYNTSRDLIAEHDQIDALLLNGARSFFGGHERFARMKVQESAADLKALLAKSAPRSLQHGGIGHNQPPPDIQLEEEQREELKVAVEIISDELGKKQPDARQVSRAARVLQSIGSWAAKKLDITLDAFLKSIGTTLGIGAAGTVSAMGIFGIDTVIQKALEFYQWVINWLNAVVWPF